MHRPPKFRMAFLLIAALLLPLLAACGGDAGDDSADISLAPTETKVAQETTEQTSTPASSPIDNLVGRKSPTEPASDATEESTVPAGIVIGTAESNEPIVKNTPSGPAPTQAPAPPSDFDGDGDGFYTADELSAAIRALFPTYDWPEDYQITADIIIAGMRFEDFPDSQYQAPGEYTIIGMYHMCAWQFALLDAVHADDADQIDRALYQLKDIGLTKNPLSSDQEAKRIFTEMYDRAALGDPARLQQEVDNNCGYEKEVFITPGTPMSDSPPAATVNDTKDAVR